MEKEKGSEAREREREIENHGDVCSHPTFFQGGYPAEQLREPGETALRGL